MSGVIDALSRETLAIRRQILVAIASLITLVSVGLITAAITSTILNNYPAFERMPPLLGIAIWAPLFIAAPILWCVALVFHDFVSRVLLNVHAAIFTVGLVVDVWQTHTHASPAALIVLVAHSFLVVLVGIDLLVAYVSARQAAAKPRHIADLAFIYIGLTIAAVAGLYLGVRAWSPAMPPRVIAAAETAAQGQPYCILVDGVPARNAADLTGTRMQARYDGDWAYNFHSLLVVKAGGDFAYFNWSYRSGKFEPVSQRARWDLHLDSLPRCKAEAHFARDWQQ